MSVNKNKQSYEDVLKNIERKRINRENEELNIGWYCWLLSEYPALIIFLCVCLSSTLLVVTIVYGELPDFSDPAKGFEVRGTELSDRLVTWENMLNQTGYNSTLSNYPYVYLKRKALMEKARKKNKRKKKKKKNRMKRSFNDDWNFITDGYTCPNSREPIVKLGYSRWIYEATDGVTLWSLQSLLQMCKTEHQVLDHQQYPEVCLRKTLSSCCPTISLANHVAYISGVESCFNLTQDDILKAEQVLRLCAPYYCSGDLQLGCNSSDTNTLNRYISGTRCGNVPGVCTDALYNIFHYLIQGSLCTNHSMRFNFTLSSVFLPAYTGKGMLDLYYDKFHNQPQQNSIKVSSINFGVDGLVFEDLLLADSIYPGVAMLLLLVIVWIYTSSLFITTMHLVATTAAMVTSYFIYQFIFDVTFFPFLNLTSTLVMLGLSTDHILVLYSTWKRCCSEDKIYERVTTKHPVGRRIGVVAKSTMRHVGWSLFVTSFTTSSAFFSNAWSSVSAIKCFGIYTGLAVLCNLIFALTWLPASIIFHHKYLQFTCNTKSVFCCIIRPFTRIRNQASEVSRVFFHQIQVLLVVRFRILWVTFFTLLAITSMYIVVFNPGFQLPRSASYLQFFEQNHPFEQYPLQQRYFDFDKDYKGFLTVRFIFGIEPIDDGNPRNPDDKGNIHFTRFNVSDPQSQRWLLNFCTILRSHKFYREPENSQFNSMCFIETLKKWIESRSCKTGAPCCKMTRFPYKPNVFELCLKEAISRLNVVPQLQLFPSSPGPRFDSKDVIRSVIVEFPTNQKTSSTQSEIAEFVKEIDETLQVHVETAPRTLAGGWFVSSLNLYALQTSLYTGTLTSVGISLLVAQIVILVTSRNLVVSIFVNLSIGGVIFVTVAALALAGWELNVLESVTVSISVGLSVDFTAHYAIAYLLAPEKGDRQRRVEHALARIGSAIATAAFTTFLAGLGMLPASVLAYKRFGIFLMVIMTASWVYSNYFFLGLLSLLGPQGNCGSLSCLSYKKNENEEHTTTLITESTSVRPALIEGRTISTEPSSINHNGGNVLE
ncbi:protein dispatched homolog 1-like [Ciona intestinalis]